MTRDTKRASRQASEVPQVAIAGYTNAGKSTLMRRITGADVIVADQLFATLDPTTRKVVLPGGRRAVISDTVGFVGKLPHDLVEAFRSTLEEVTLADLVVHIADASSATLEDQIEAVRRVLEEIGAGDIPEVLALNKIDRVAGSERVRLARRFPGSVPVSALTGEGVDGLLLALAETLPDPPVHVEALVPWDRGDLVAMLYREAEVLSADGRARGHAGRGERGPAGARRAPAVPHEAGCQRLRRAHGAPIDHRDGSAQRPVNGASGSTPRAIAAAEGQDLEPHHRGDLRQDRRAAGRPR